MKRVLFFLILILIIISCKNGRVNQTKDDNKEFAEMLDEYFSERMQLFPLEATLNGYNRLNNLLPADFTDSYRQRLIDFFNRYQESVNTFNRERLNDNDRISYDIIKHEIEMNLEGLSDFHLYYSTYYFIDSYMPFDQFSGVPLLIGQMGSGTTIQPFNTITDYENWLQRAKAFSSCADSAIVYFRKGMAVDHVLPKAIVLKMIPQFQAMVTDSATKSLFYEPVKLMPATFSEADKNRLTETYIEMINQQIEPSYNKLAVFFQTEYLPVVRNTTGVNALPHGINITILWLNSGLPPTKHLMRYIRLVLMK